MKKVYVLRIGDAMSSIELNREYGNYNFDNVYLESQGVFEVLEDTVKGNFKKKLERYKLRSIGQAMEFAKDALIGLNSIYYSNNKITRKDLDAYFPHLYNKLAIKDIMSIMDYSHSDEIEEVVQVTNVLYNLDLELEVLTDDNQKRYNAVYPRYEGPKVRKDFKVIYCKNKEIMVHEVILPKSIEDSYTHEDLIELADKSNKVDFLMIPGDGNLLNYVEEIKEQSSIGKNDKVDIFLHIGDEIQRLQ